MKQPDCRYLPVALLVFAVLLVLPGPAAADESPRTPGRAASGAIVPLRAAGCAACDSAQKRCLSKCFGSENDEVSGACLIACDNAAAICSCDEEVTLRSEDLAPWAKAGACHDTTPCGTAYPSCANWSPYSDCDDPFCAIARGCADPCTDNFCLGPAVRQGRERFRVCFNELGQSCTEYQHAIGIAHCGC